MQDHSLSQPKYVAVILTLQENFFVRTTFAGNKICHECNLADTINILFQLEFNLVDFYRILYLT